MDKTDRLLRMLEHPEQMNDEELNELLSDDECRELYEAMRLSADASEMADAREQIANGIKDEEWQKFEAAHFNEQQLPSHLSTSGGMRRDGDIFLPPSGGMRRGLKIAAMFVGILMLSGIAYAAIRIIGGSSAQKQDEQSEMVVTATPTTQGTANIEQDSTQVKNVVFENAELGTMLSDMAAYYHFEPVYKNEKAKHVRLYFTWNMEQTIDEVIEMFNKFERFHITHDENQLIVE